MDKIGGNHNISIIEMLHKNKNLIIEIFSWQTLDRQN